MMSTEAPERYGYLCLMRPPMPGAIPRDGLVECDAEEGVSAASGHHYWGRAIYSRRLTDEEVKHYDLEQGMESKIGISDE